LLKNVVQEVLCAHRGRVTFLTILKDA